MPTTTLDVLPFDLDPEQQANAVKRRSLIQQLRHGLGHADQVHRDGDIYWPVLFIHATADGRWLRKEWTERVHGAVDLVTGRIGLVDTDLPVAQPRAVPDDRRLEPAFAPSQAFHKWHEFFRDYVERRRKPLQPPAYRVDDHTLAWLPHHVVSTGSTTLLVDPVTRRVDPIEDFPSVRDQLTLGGAIAMT